MNYKTVKIRFLTGVLAMTMTAGLVLPVMAAEPDREESGMWMEDNLSAVGEEGLSTEGLVSETPEADVVAADDTEAGTATGTALATDEDAPEAEAETDAEASGTGEAACDAPVPTAAAENESASEQTQAEQPGLVDSMQTEGQSETESQEEESLLQEMDADPVEYEGEGYKLYLYEQTDGTYKAALAEVSDGADIVIPESVDGKTVTAFKPNDVLLERGNDINTMSFPDSICEITANLFNYTYGSDGQPVMSFDDGGRFCTSDFGGTEDTSNRLSPRLDPDKTLNAIPSFISSDYAEGAYYAGKCLVRADPGYKGDFSVKEGTICILSRAFEGCDSLGAVRIPDTVEFIGAGAFASSSVTDVNIPSSVKISDGNAPEIPAFAFWRCHNLKKVTIEGSIERIGYAAFFDCDGLQEFDFSKVGWIDSCAFVHAFDPAEGVAADLRGTTMNDFAVFALSGLASVTFGGDLDRIGYMCFYGNRNLKSVASEKDGIHIACNAFRGCSGISSFTMKPGVIESWAFAGAFDPNGQAAVDLSESIFMGGTEQFAGSGIYSVDFGSLSTKGDQPYYVEHRMFADCKNLHSVTGGVALDVKNCAFKNDNAIIEFTMQPGFIDCEAFYGAFDPAAKVIVDLSKADNDYSRCNASSYGGSDQFGNSGIAGVDFGDSTDYYVRQSMFSGCNYLTTIKGGEGIDFGYQSLAYKNSITTFTTKPGFISCRAFYAAFNPGAKIVVDLSAAVNGEDPLQHDTQGGEQFACSGIYGVDFGSRDDYVIHYRMFADCQYLASVRGGEGIDVETYAFSNDSNIREFTMKPGKIVSYAFQNAFSPAGKVVIDLTGADFWKYPDTPYGVTYNGEPDEMDNGAYHFESSGLKGVVFGDSSLKYVACCAFRYNNSLTDVTFGSYQKGIRPEAFSYCTSLEKDILADSQVETLEYIGISNTAIKELTIPESMTDLRGQALCHNKELEVINWKSPAVGTGNHLFDVLNGSGYSSVMHFPLPMASEEIQSYFDNDLSKVETAPKVLNIYTFPKNESSPKYDGMFFKMMPTIETVNIMVPVTEIPKEAFQGCLSLKHFTLSDPEALEKIGDRAFAVTGLKETVVMKGVKYGTNVFQNDRLLKTVVVEDGVTEIAPFMFEQCMGIKEIAIPDSLKKVGWAAFKSAGSGMRVYVPKGTTLVEDDAFGLLEAQAGANSIEVILAGDPSIELYHPSSEDDSAKTTEALDSRSVTALYTDEQTNFRSYEAGASHLPELNSGVHYFTFKASQKGIQAGGTPDKALVTVTMDGRELNADEFDLIYDKNVRSGGLEVTIVPVKPYDNPKKLLPCRISAGNFYSTRTYGTVYNFGEYEMSYVLDIYDYTFTEGDKSTWTKDKDTKDLPFTVKRVKLGNGNLKNLYKEIRIDGKKTTVNDLTFKNDYVSFKVPREDLLKLKNGSHDIIAVFTDGKAGASFTIKEAPKLTVTVTKVWDDDGNEDGIRPSAADYAKYLYIEDQEFRKAGVTPTIKDNGNNTYTITYKGLSPMTDWVASEYVVNELPIAGYTTFRDWAKDGGTMTGVRQRSARLVSGHIYTILSAKDDTFALDIAGGSRLAGANADIYKKNGTEAQAFVISKANDGGWKILNYKGMMLGIAGGAKENGGNLETAEPDGSSVQSFRVVENTDGTITFLNQNSGLALDVAGGKMLKGQNVQQYKPNGSDAQKWVLVDITAAMKKTCPRTWQGTYTIASASNGNYVLDISKGAKSNKANVQIYKANGTKAQKFRVTYRGDGLYSITNVNSGRVLDVKGGKAANKRNVWQYKWNGSKAQLWQITENADGSVTFKTALNVACALDVSGGKMKNKQNVQIYKANGTKAQSWILKKS